MGEERLEGIGDIYIWDFENAGPFLWEQSHPTVKEVKEFSLWSRQGKVMKSADQARQP